MTAVLELDCLACGSTLIYAAGTTSTHCTVCDDERPLPMRFSGIEESSADDEEAPEHHALLPFLLDEEAARKAISRQRPYLGELRRRYLPALVSRAHISTRYEGERGVLRGSAHNHTKRLEWEPAEGLAERPFENELGYPIEPPSRKEMNALGPWDWAFAEPFDAAQVGDAELLPVPGPAQQRFTTCFPPYENDMKAEVAYAIGGEEQRIHQLEHRLTDATYRIVHLPLWVGVLETGRSVYVNGRTSEVVIEGRATDIAHAEEALPDIGDDQHMKRTLAVLAFISIVVGAVLIGALS